MFTFTHTHRVLYVCVCIYIYIYGLGLWNINHCRFFNAKSIFVHINSSISNNSV